MSAGPSKTDARHDNSNVSPPLSTVPSPASGRIITSVSLVSRVISLPGCSAMTCRLDSVHRADSGVTSTV
jgi:hypothetical protein